MSGREELELAAKAAGLRHDGWHRDGGLAVWRGCFWASWDPRRDPGHALELQVRLALCVTNWPRHNPPHAMVGYSLGPGHGTNVIVSHGDDALQANMEAIFRAAVEIGRAMK